LASDTHAHARPEEVPLPRRRPASWCPAAWASKAAA